MCRLRFVNVSCLFTFNYVVGPVKRESVDTRDSSANRVCTGEQRVVRARRATVSRFDTGLLRFSVTTVPVAQKDIIIIFFIDNTYG